LFDGGANFGLSSFGIAGSPDVCGVEFHLFEANPQLLPVLRKSRQLYPATEIEIIHGCLSDAAGSSRLNIAKRSSGQSFVSSTEGESVPNVVLDDYIDLHRIPEVTFMKLDIEGHEPVALRGLTRSLQRNLLQALYFEVSPPNLKRAGFSVCELLVLLREKEFSLFLCKEDDIERMPTARWFSCQIHSLPLRLAELTEDSLDIQTDLLAINKRSRFFAMIEDSKAIA
jgi:FkbM family methyltransferase